MIGTLFLVATPIGNLSDMSFRAIETLKSVNLIACEDTRHTRKLLTNFEISNRLMSYHEYNEEARAEELAAKLLAGLSIAIVSDAGTPAICDPSFRIVQRAHEIGAKVVAVPGPVAFVNAAVVSGLPTDSIFFGGFLPSKTGERQKRLAEVSTIPATLCFYESPHRIMKSLSDCLKVLGDRNAAIVREITKLHEERIFGTLSELVERNLHLKGEIVLVIDRKGKSSAFEESGQKSLVERYLELETELDSKSALKKVAKEFGVGKSDAYRQIQLNKEK